MKKKEIDHYKVAEWPEMHWDIALGVCAMSALACAVMQALGLFRLPAAIIAGILAIAYTLGLTWYFSRYAKKPPKTTPATGPNDPV